MVRWLFCTVTSNSIGLSQFCNIFLALKHSTQSCMKKINKQKLRRDYLWVNYINGVYVIASKHRLANWILTAWSKCSCAYKDPSPDGTKVTRRNLARVCAAVFMTICTYEIACMLMHAEYVSRQRWCLCAVRAMKKLYVHFFLFSQERRRKKKRNICFL